jgi:hypothetical protein
LIRFTIQSWSAWAPGLETAEDWRRFARDPIIRSLDGAPAVKFVPAMQRRRLSRLSRMALQAAFDACPPELRSQVSTVFASRHGESELCVALLSDIVRDLALSPTQFSHSVHNTQAALYSIEAGNGGPSTSVAAQQDTFCAGLVEALGLCRRHRPLPTLLVVADEPWPKVFRSFDDELPASYGAAWLVEEGLGSEGMSFEMELVPSAAPVHDASPRWPDALLFLAWMLGDETEFTLARGPRNWCFRRVRR